MNPPLAFTQCHAKGFIYRDVKADNFLFESNSPESPLKATDFGLSIKYSPGEPKLSSRSGMALGDGWAQAGKIEAIQG